MKTYSFDGGTGEEVMRFEVPDGVAVDALDLFLLGAIEMQEQVANGNLKVTDRVWPCMRCNKNMGSQENLLVHLKSHAEKISKEKAEILERIASPSPIPPAASDPPARKRGRPRKWDKEGNPITVG